MNAFACQHAEDAISTEMPNAELHKPNLTLRSEIKIRRKPPSDHSLGTRHRHGSSQQETPHKKHHNAVFF